MTVSGKGTLMEFHSLDTEDVALERLAAFGDDARILAGGTDLVLQHRRGEVPEDAWLFIGRIASLRSDRSSGTDRSTWAPWSPTGPSTPPRAVATARRARDGGGHRRRLADPGRRHDRRERLQRLTGRGHSCPPLLVADAEVTLAPHVGRPDA